MLHRIFFILSIILIQPAFADKAADKAEFKKLYAEFNELYSSSNDLELLITKATAIRDLAPKAYGKNSNNNAVAIYNLASLYDEFGGSSVNQAEGIAVELYKKYFKILDKLKTPKNISYLEQYKKFVIAEFNYKQRFSKDSFAKNALGIAYALNLPNLEIADFEYLIAYQRLKSGDLEKAANYFSKAKARYINYFGNIHIKVGRSVEWLAKIQQMNEKHTEAEKLFQEAISIYEKLTPTDPKLIAGAYHSLARTYLSLEKYDEAARFGVIASDISKETYDTSLPTVRHAPNYPIRAAENGIEGWVLLEFEVNTTGHTENVRVIESSHKMFEINAIRAVRKFRYIPKPENGKRVVSSKVRNRIEFTLVG